jgi:CRP/FNR family transcriptional regulator, nitrogen oxide reductase regulator
VPDTAQKLGLIETFELFSGLDFSACAYMASIARFKYFACGDVIFVAGEPISDVLILAEGRVKLSQVSEKGYEVILRLCSPGEEIYSPSFVHQGEYFSSAQALQACRVLAWDVRNFRDAQERFPILQGNGLSTLARRTQELERRYYDVSTRNIAPRLARGVIQLVDQIGKKVDGHVEIHLSQESLAQMMAMTASSVSRLLTKWELEGLVSLRRGAIAVRSVSGLSDICQAK